MDSEASHIYINKMFFFNKPFKKHSNRITQHSQNKPLFGYHRYPIMNRCQEAVYSNTSRLQAHS